MFRDGEEMISNGVVNVALSDGHSYKVQRLHSVSYTFAQFDTARHVTTLRGNSI